MQFNPTFKRPDAIALHPGRSPSPPRKFVEPLSPLKPGPVEPSFNYPTLNKHADATARADHPVAATPKQRHRSSSHKSGHHRTPSTIDTLAEAALAASPAFHTQASPIHNGFAPPQPMRSTYAGQEPPHKRARSEVFPSPMVGQYASRPATSYESTNSWSRGAGQQNYGGDAYDSRVEEAALLLNFRTGGWPTSGNRQTHAPLYSRAETIPTASRPHANSFPQAQHARPLELSAQGPLLPPFNPEQSTHSPPVPGLTAREHHDEGLYSAPEKKSKKPAQHSMKQAAQVEQHTADDDVKMSDASQHIGANVEEENSRATSSDVTVSEASEVHVDGAPKPRAKPRTIASRRNTLEKAASKRAASRKKTPDLSKSRKKTTAANIQPGREVKPAVERRKSVGDLERQLIDVMSVRREQSVPADTGMTIRVTSPTKQARKIKEVAVETFCAGCQTIRETLKANPELDDWVCCNGCKKWFHLDCAGFKKASEVRDVDKYFCTACEPTHGKTTYVRKSTRAHASVDYAELQRGVLKTSEESNEHHYIQPIKDGTFQFDLENFPRIRPELVTREFFERSGLFTEPICIPADLNPRPWLQRRKRAAADRGAAATEQGEDLFGDLLPEDFEYDTVADDGQDKLDMVMPEDLTVRQVCNLAGPDTPLDVIDVKTQNSGAKWNLARWADYYEEAGDDKPIRNVISLEVSQTKLGRLLRRPKIVRDIDLQDEVWPQEEKDKGKWPKVQFYCLMSVADSYTDFHIDFGGSSVYYHILKGKKTFFFIPPKTKHLKAYEEWNDSPQQNYTFLPSITKECYRVDLHEGDTMLIPSGWIHAVWTPETSLVIGGNFLTRMSFQNQFKVVEIEKANETPMKFRYPYFQKLMWYTAIKYLKDDPLPAEVSQGFYDGKRFERDRPVWADFDGEMAASDDRAGLGNARYYSQAEVEGLPELANFIFRTVMLVMGRVEGISADRMKRVNSSIPKGHGEPLEIAKTFALWVAWKRGNEDPPAWAHPEAVLPNNSKDEGPPKKLSARALKEMERKEAIAAWRIAPDRQSERVRKAAAAASDAVPPGPKGASATTPDRATSFTPSRPSQQHSKQALPHQDMAVQAPPVAAPMALMMNGSPTHYLSTPKTSVLGPKRVACDACRKRRIRCKHKDLVLQATPDHLHAMHPSMPSGAPMHAFAGQESHDAVAASPPKTNHHFATDAQNATLANAIDGLGPLPGTNAYINANIPMTMNGVPIFGDSAKRGRTKACFECKKSKRRCVHDENGNVDPVKAAETPVPRGSCGSKKRQSGGDGSASPTQQQRKSKSSPQHERSAASSEPQSFENKASQSQRSLSVSSYPSHYQAHGSASQQPTQQSPINNHNNQTPLDPDLFAYPEPADDSAFGSNSYPYPAPERPQAYTLPSLEQIANEVLDMNGRSHEDHQHDPLENVHVYNPNDIGIPSHDIPTGHPKPDESVDSAISLPGSDSSEHKSTQPNGNTATASSENRDEQSRETNGLTSPSLERRIVSDLPLYRPPAPLPTSPEQGRRHIHLPDGPATDSIKRKRDSVSDRSASHSTKKPKMAGSFEESKQLPVIDDERESLELAKALQADENGLRRRTSR